MFKIQMSKAILLSNADWQARYAMLTVSDARITIIVIGEYWQFKINCHQQLAQRYSISSK